MSGGITFYSTKRSSNVNIPQSKVCGYRITNPIMKNGWSSGLRSGADNGVVNQKLSRFSEDWEAEELKQNCSGNTNWLSGRKPKFNTPESADNQFWVKRPTFLAGTEYDDKNADPIPINERAGLGNRDITRRNFLAPPIKPRFTKSFEELQSVAVSEAGEVQSTLGNKLGYFTTVRVPDPTDRKWLQEKARLQRLFTAQFTAAGIPANQIPALVMRELEINKPLGRDQRTVNKSADTVSNENRLSTAAKLRQIEADVRAGRAETRAGQTALTAQLTLIFNDTQAIGALTQAQLVGLGQALARIGVPTQYKRLGLIPRYVDITFYNANAGMINLLFFSKVRETPNTNLYNYDKLVRNFVDDPINGLPVVPAVPVNRQGAIKLTSMVGSLGRPGGDRRYIDLERGGVISRAQLRAAAAADGVGGFAGQNFDIQVGNQ